MTNFIETQASLLADKYGEAISKGQFTYNDLDTLTETIIKNTLEEATERAWEYCVKAGREGSWNREELRKELLK